jgi:hypothetical protein
MAMLTPSFATVEALSDAGRSPLWVISGHVRCKKRCPLYPNSDRKRRHAAMVKPTCGAQLAMSGAKSGHDEVT